MDNTRVCAIVPTYNRKDLLTNCLKAMLSGIVVPEIIIIVDNASTDGTKEHIASLFPKEVEQEKVVYIRLEENLGSAGGFAVGLQKGMEMGADYFWLMDNDAEPTENALLELLRKVNQETCVVAIPTDRNKKELSYPLVIRINNKVKTFQFFDEIPNYYVLEAPFFAQFTGMLIPKNIVSNIGLPRVDYFAWADDVEYVHRIWENGYKVIYIRESIVYHPTSKKITTNFLWKNNIVLLDAPDWRQYYDLRNHVHLLSRRNQWIDVVGRIIYFFLVWKARGAKLNTLHFYIKGIWHGITGKLGRNDEIMPRS